MRSSHLIAMAAVSCLAAAAHAQAPAFDVISIRQNPAAANSLINPTPNGQLTVTAATVRELVLRAYGLHDLQLLGAPAWAGSERFDIAARVQPPPEGGPEGLMPLLRTLLAERFRLKAHDETRELQAYVLIHARSDRRLGPQIRPTESDCTRTTPVTQAEIKASLKDGWPPCGQVFQVSYLDAADSLSRIKMRRSAVTMRDFARILQASVGRPVVDRTDLTGRFDVEYSFAPSPSSTRASDSNLPSLLVSLEEQLGLKIETRRTAVPVLVIDSVELPAPN